MKINWIPKYDADSRWMKRYSAYCGVAHCNVWEFSNGNQPYEIYFRSKGKKRVVLHVDDNYTVDAKKRCEYLLKALSNGLQYDLLPIEDPRVSNAAHIPDTTKPEKRARATIAGLQIGRIYEHLKSGGYYHLLLITNIDSTDPKWVPTVCYQNVFTGLAYSRPLSEFTEDKYRLVNFDEKLPVPQEGFNREAVLETA